MQSPCRQSSSLPTGLLRAEARAGKESALILTNDQPEGLQDGATCVPVHDCFRASFVSFDERHTVTVHIYLLVPSSSSSDSPFISLQLLLFAWGNVRGKAS